MQKQTAEQRRLRRNDYQRTYRAANPDKARAWREAYILRKADRLRAEHARQQEGGEQRD